MNIMPEIAPCDVIMTPSLGEMIEEVAEDHVISIIILLVGLLLFAAIATIMVVSRKKSRDAQKNTIEENAEEELKWEE